MAPTLKRLADSRLPPVSVPATSRGTFGSESMFRKRRPTNPAAPGSNPNPSGCKWVCHLPWIPFDGSVTPSKEAEDWRWLEDSPRCREGVF